MNSFRLIISVLILNVLFLSSCHIRKIDKTQTVWEQGISTINGKIESVKQEKDGQTIQFKTNEGESYVVVVSIPNLGENAHQYREFKVGEEIGFQGETLSLDNQKRMIVRSILEYY